MNLKWNANPETDIANYRVNYGTSSGSHPNSVNAGLSTRASVTGLLEGTTYFFVVTAINLDGLESEPSDEVSYQVPVTQTGPVAVSKAATTTEDTPVAIALSASDANGQSLTYSIVSGPAKGALSGTAPNLTYTPNANSNGADSFTYKANNGTLDSNTATVSITVSPVNDMPVAVSKSATTNEDTQVAIVLAASDVDGDSLTYSIVSGPAKGTLSGTAPNLTYTPSADFNGADSFTYKASDATLSSANATVSITVSPLNDAPVAVAKSATTNEDTQVAIVLSATDKDGDSLTYSIVSGPAKGTLSGTAPNLTYTPSADFNGADSFTYKASDATLSSANATVSITVSPLNDAPVAVSKSATTNEDTQVAIVLSATDKDGDSLTYSIVSGPAKGTLSGTAPNLTYTPSADFNGADSFTYKASDATLSSVNATVSITVSPLNDAPVAVSKSATTNEDTQVAIVLSATDKDGDSLTYSIVSGPAKGTLSGTAPNLTYTPSADFNGADSFTYKASDATLSSANATVSITVSPLNDAPVAVSKSATTNEDTQVAIVLSATDKDGDSLAYSIVSGPAKGTLSGTAPNLTYTPSADFNGADSFTYKASDASLSSINATVSITVSSVNDTPVAVSKSATTAENTPVAILLSASDKDGDSLTYSIVSGPTKGTLSGTAPNLTYTPSADFSGVDSFTYKAGDATSSSLNATVSITITSVNHTPVAVSKSATTNEDAPVAIVLSASDIDGDSLTYSIVNGPAKGTLSGTAPNLTYTPSADFNGADSFTYKASDASLSSLNATVSITVSSVNDTPVAASKSATTAENTPLSILLSASDKDGDSLTYSIVSGPTKGTLSGTAPNLTYTPSADFNGMDSFTYKASDATSSSLNATVSITVSSVNHTPVAVSKSATTAEDVPVAIVLSASDIDGDSLTYSIVNGPAKGTFSGTAPNLTYTPSADFNGVDSFTYKASDATLSSANATVSITVSPLNDAPVAVSKSATANEDTQVAIVLAASDIDGDSLTYSIVSGPAKGTLSGTAPNLTYTPSADFNGSDSFTYKASDATSSSLNATVSITVSSVNDAPVAISKSATTNEDTPVAIALAASDKDGDSLTYSIVSGPASGTLSGNPPNMTYSPSAGFSGADSFTFTANDGKANSPLATISITVTKTVPPDDGNLISQVGWALRHVDSENAAGNPAINAFDGNPNTFWHTGLPSGTAPQAHEIEIDLGRIHTLKGFRYLPRQDGNSDGNISQYEFHTSIDGATWGPPAATGTFSNSPAKKDVFFAGLNARYIRLRSLTEVNGGIQCNVAELNLLWTIPVNQAPVVDSQALATSEATPVAVELTGTDHEGDELTYSIVTGPANGELSGTAPDLTYTPAPGFIGGDSFTFQASDGRASSNTATVSISVTSKETGHSNNPPVFASNSISLNGGYEGALSSTLSITDTAEDPDQGDSITFSKVAGPAWLKISPKGRLSGTPPAGSQGRNRFTVRATDKAGAFTESILIIKIDSDELPLPWEMEQLGGGKDNRDLASQQFGTLTLNGSGALTGTSDSGSLIWQTLSGDGEITARVASIKKGEETTRAGLMIRDSLAPTSNHVFIGVDGDGGFRWVRRTQKGKPAVTKTTGSGSIPNAWMRLVRKGDTIIAYKSADGSAWKRVGATTVELGQHCYIGLSMSGGKDNTGAAAFRDVKVKH